MDGDSVVCTQSDAKEGATSEGQAQPTLAKRPSRSARSRRPVLQALCLLVPFSLGLGAGFAAWGRPRLFGIGRPASDASAIAKEVNPAAGYKLPVSFGDVGPKLLAAGAIDETKFLQLYESAGQPLTDEQLEVLRRGGDRPIVVDSRNAYFLLNLLWALGLANDNPLLKQGPMVEQSGGQIARYASTGGWTLATKPIADLYASASIIKLTAEQQVRLEEVASAAYRPCCNNPTSFPDCNHGMALLGLLELMAAQGASTQEMFTAAKEVDAFWFPQQAFELATYIRDTTGKSFAQMDGRQAVDRQHFSAAGYQTIAQYLATKGLLQDSPNSGSGCGV